MADPAPVANAEDPLLLLMPFGLSLALGALVGVERQRSHGPDTSTMGIRTFPLMALLGCAAAFLGQRMGWWAFVSLTIAFAGLVTAFYVMTSLKQEPGMTTETAALVTFSLGAMVQHDQALLASSIAVAMTVILSLRRPLHELVQKIEEEDLYAALKLGILTLVILPILPNKVLPYGPEAYRLFNPYKMWLLVVLIAGIGFLGYVGVKVLGPGRGIAVAGGLGGLVSSTAVTLSFSGRSKESPELSRAYALGIAIAWAAMFLRVILEVAAVDRELLPYVVPPVGAAMLGGTGGAAILYLRSRGAEPPPVIAHKNPFRLASAFKFGILFTVILFVAKFAQDQFETAGVFAAAVLTGTTDVDAMTLSVANLSHKGELDREVASGAICLTVASNTIVKAILAARLGAPGLRRALMPIVGVTLLAGGGALFVVTR